MLHSRGMLLQLLLTIINWLLVMEYTTCFLIKKLVTYLLAYLLTYLLTLLLKQFTWVTWHCWHGWLSVRQSNHPVNKPVSIIPKGSITKQMEEYDPGVTCKIATAWKWCVCVCACMDELWDIKHTAQRFKWNMHSKHNRKKKVSSLWRRDHSRPVRRAVGCSYQRNERVGRRHN